MANEEELELRVKYPLITTEKDTNCIIYKGILRVNNTDVKISIRRKYNIDEKSDFEIEECDIIGQSNVSLKQLPSGSIVTFLDNLCFLLNSQLKPCENLTHIYKKVLHEYCEFTNFFLTVRNCGLSKDLTQIKVSMVDDKNRMHHSEISVDYTQLNKMFYFSSCDLPQSFQYNASLVELYNEYVTAIEVLQPYFNFMDTLDHSTFVLDPENPQRANTFRRIWLAENLSVLITVDPFKLYNRPDIKFLGPDRLVDEYHTKLNNNLENWEVGKDTFENILNILGITSFPQRNTEHKSSEHILKDTGDCAICFSARFNDKLPDVICSNKSCENFYHTECLYEWLISIDGRRIFNEIHGQCPNCEKDIFCNVPFVTELK